MARQTTSGRQTAKPARDELPQPDVSALLPLVRLLARQAAREAWTASQTTDSTSHDQDPPAPS